ncbi:heparin lyase I family protein [Paraburkholderia sp. FT54]|uniref:heparin lyase I family protein n=1 Tax=Paraburkholderia sp. FT54 TaxID=3074437 RepID=UPI002877C38A|nr:heparin lyase I family protein [Paraburkholderia sp. FT54]WNC92373.1 heparin lyase I family protein [Paraburkholderia sp. FT54]
MAQDIGLAWTDPQMTALASTYDKVFSTEWDNGIGAGIGVQANPGDIGVVDDPVVAGRKAVRVRMTRSEDFSKIANGVPRAELIFPNAVSFSQGPDYLLRWSTFIPAGFAFDSKQAVIITQIHQGEWTGGPTVALSLQGKQYAISERGGANTSTVSAGKWLCCADADKGKWVNWSLRYLADDSDQHASTQLWKDGRSVFASQGVPNAYSGVQDAYLKMGLYKSGWNRSASDVSEITLFFGPVSVSKK